MLKLNKDFLLEKVNLNKIQRNSNILSSLNSNKIHENSVTGVENLNAPVTAGGLSERVNYKLRENVLKSALAAGAITASSMAMPPAEDIPHIDQILKNIGAAEHRGSLGDKTILDYDPKFYVRTGKPDPILNRDKKEFEIKHSTAYGPFQFTKSTVEDLSSRHKELFAGTEEYVDKFVAQGNKMLKDPNDPVFGYGKAGELSGKDYHEQYVNMSRAGLAAMAKDLDIKDIKNMSPQEEAALLKRFRGFTPEGSYMKAYLKSKQSSATTTTPKTETKTATPPPPTSSSLDHKVNPGDTLGAISKKYGVSVDDIMKINPNIKDPNKIQAGQKIKIK